jgi:NAD(P)-dependent dehydrogenase (short-subunit alcohol dehydrogenase family)/enamine deaminase RidA (YjgF/YER057c/UK114 family)
VALVARTRSQLQEAAAAIDAECGRAAALPFPADVADRDSALRCVEAARRAIGPLEVLVNAAGTAEGAPYSRTDDALLGRLLGVNLLGAHHMMSAIIPEMARRGSGHVVNVASTAALEGFAYASAYAASKHALLGLTRSVALEAGRAGVRVNCVCPGFVDTPLLDRSVAEIVERTGRTAEQARAALARLNPSGRLLRPEEVADAVLWLLGAGRDLNGQAVVVDGRAAAWTGDPPLPVNPEPLGRPSGYSNGLLLRAGRTLFVAGQVAWDRERRIMGGDDFAAQFDAALGNVLAVVREAGGRPDQIGRLRIYVADVAGYRAALKEVGAAYRRRMGSHYPAMALVEVGRLLEEGALVEIEAEAIL